MRTTIALLLIGLAGCTSSVTQITTPNGRQAYEFHCGGPFDSRTSCNLNAMQACPYGYYPLDASDGRLVAVCSPAAQPTRRPS